jgi:hypothetical protein
LHDVRLGIEPRLALYFAIMHYCDTCVLDWRMPTADISAALM